MSRFQTKQKMQMQIKGISEAGEFEGLLSVYGVKDEGDDIVEPGAYTKTIKDNGNEVPMLWQHKSDQPIGKLILEDSPEALKVRGQLMMTLPDGSPFPEAQKAYGLIKAGIVKGLSIGFKSMKDNIIDGVRKIKEIKLYEGSIVTFPMNEACLITAVKAAAKKIRERKDDMAGMDMMDAADTDTDDFNDELNELQLYNAECLMFQALRNSLRENIQEGEDPQGIISLATTILQQFTTAYLAYLPEFLTVLDENEDDMPYYGSYSKDKHDHKSGRAHSAETMGAFTEVKGHLDNAQTAMGALMSYQGPANAAGDKMGMTHSAATVQQMMTVKGYADKASKKMGALLTDVAGTTTSTAKAASKTEPEVGITIDPKLLEDVQVKESKLDEAHHSAVATAFEELKALFPAA